MSRWIPSTAGFWAVKRHQPVAGKSGSKNPGSKNPVPEKGDFPWIKRGLDPKASYVVFEHGLKFQGESIFDSTHGVYAFLEQEGLSWQHVVDMDLSVEYLVIRVSPGREDQILGKVLGSGFSENIVFYIFKAEEV